MLLVASNDTYTFGIRELVSYCMRKDDLNENAYDHVPRTSDRLIGTRIIVENEYREIRSYIYSPLV